MTKLQNKIVKINNTTYEILTNYRDAFKEEEFQSKYTEYFEDYDYIVGDIAYGKLRLKGFYHSKNKKVKKLNCFDNLENYLKVYCAPDCRYFVLKKEKK